MTVLSFAYAVDKIVSSKLGYDRSAQSKVQKAVADQMIVDHYEAKSSADETAELVFQALKTLENA